MSIGLVKKIVFVVLLFGSSAIWGQGRFQSGDLKGFTISPNEHIINHLDQPFAVRGVNGAVVFGDGSPMAMVLFEMRGPGNSQAIKAATTGPDGAFHIGNVYPGKYLFKATALGFQSIVGEVIISREAVRSQAIKLEMKPGV